jgi:hypothetical protein
LPGEVLEVADLPADGEPAERTLRKLICRAVAEATAMRLRRRDSSR